MLEKIWFTGVLDYLKNGLDGASLRQKVYAHNLANVNTPNFKASSVEFEKTLEATLERKDGMTVTNPRHLKRSEGEPETAIVQDGSTSMRSDGNNVDVDKEMTRLAMNQLYYNALTQQLNDRLGMIRYVINEGRR